MIISRIRISMVNAYFLSSSYTRIWLMTNGARYHAHSYMLILMDS